MEKETAGQGMVLVICATESFLAKSLVSKIRDLGIRTEFSRGQIREIDALRGEIELVILFMNEGMEEMSDTLIFLKDMLNDLDRKMILIGDPAEYELIKQSLSETLFLEWFRRPLVMDDLTKCVLKYMEENTGENRKKTILIVDDDITYMRTVYEWLKDGYHVGMAANGVQAISFLARNRTDLILLDYEMPVTSGPQVMEMLRNDSETGQIPVMFLTGHGDRESVLSVVGLAPVDYLLKTIDKYGLQKKIADFFQGRKAQ